MSNWQISTIFSLHDHNYDMMS